MRKETSCGCIIIKDKKVLVIHQKGRDYWCFPKGHIEEGETEIETALREVKEEVGLEVEIVSNKRYTLNYILELDDTVDKTCVFYLATPKNDKIKMQESEIEDFKWCSYKEALDILTFDDWKEMFQTVIKDLS